jgi:hypothetical protein
VITLIGPFLAALLVSATADWPISGVVIDSSGKPVPGAEVVLAAGMTKDGSVPILVQTKADDAGRFHFARLTPEKLADIDTTRTLWAYKPGLGMGMVDLLRNDKRDQVHRLVLETEAPRRLTIHDADGKPIAGVRVAPRIVQTEQTSYMGIAVPDDWLDRLSGLTDERGTAALPSLTRKIELRSTRVSIPGRGTHVLMVPYSRGKDEVTLTVARACRLEARVHNSSSGGVANAIVELWVRSGVPFEENRFFYLTPERIALDEKTSRTGPDGLYRAPVELLVGSTYRLVVRAEGFSPLLSRWFTVGEGTNVLTIPPLKKLRTLEGQVVDRQGKPVAGVAVYQAASSTSATTDERGGYRLEKARPGRTFVLARKAGYRLQGQAIEDDSKHPVRLTLTRDSERPERLMATLPPLLPIDESRALARRVLDPILKEVAAKGDDAAKLWLIRVLRWIDPPAILEQVEKLKFDRGSTADYLKGEAALGIVSIDPDEALAVAETIVDPSSKAGTLVDLADALPTLERSRKLELLDMAAVAARAAKLNSNKFFQMGEVGEHWLELGERTKATALFTEGLKLVETLPPLKRTDAGGLLSHLAWLDPRAPVDLLEGVGPDRWHERILANIAIRAAYEHPADAERILGLIHEPTLRVMSAPRICRRMARNDPDRGRRIAASLPSASERAIAWTFLADGLRMTDPAAARAALDQAITEIDNPENVESEREYQASPAVSILPLVERIAPDRVEEVFWRAVAQQSPGDDPRDDLGSNSSEILIAQALLLSRYDRAVAATLFEPVAEYVRNLPLRAGNDLSPSTILAMASLDPRAAVELVEKLPKARSLSIIDPTNWARSTLADHLAKPPDRRWMSIWRFHSGCGIAMFEEVYRDL